MRPKRPGHAGGRRPARLTESMTGLASAEAVPHGRMRRVPHEMDQGLGQADTFLGAGQADATAPLTARNKDGSKLCFIICSTVDITFVLNSTVEVII